MKLYLISQTVNLGYDIYDSAVVAAESEDAARNIHPRKFAPDWDSTEWCEPDSVKVTFIGTSDCIPESGVICASFNAG
jgi:hypothetical protein